MGIKEEVASEILTLLQSLKEIGEKNPDSPVRAAAEDFNRLLSKAKEACPDLRGIQDTTPIVSADNLTTAITRLSIIYGAICAEGT